MPLSVPNRRTRPAPLGLAAVAKRDSTRDGNARDASLTSVFAALAANTAIAIAKGVAAALTGSAALFAETLHTVADAGNEVFLYVAIRRSERAPDRATRWATARSAGTGAAGRGRMFVVGGARVDLGGPRRAVPSA